MKNPTMQPKSEAFALFDRVCTMFGPNSWEAQTMAKIAHTMETSTVGEAYVKQCHTCRCPHCGKTRADAAAEARSRLRRERKSGIERSLPSADHDSFLDAPDEGKFSVAEVAARAFRF